MRIVLGVGGGIAVYKACELVSRLVQNGHEVRVVMTRSASHFVAPLTFAALSGQSVGIEMDDEPYGAISHVRLAHWAEAMIVAPAPAELLGRLAGGIASDLLSLTYFGMRGHILVAPAMEPEMWDHPAIQRQVERLRSDHIRVIGPEQGRMASGAMGVGRMAEPATIAEMIRRLEVPLDWKDRKVLITAGPTWEYFDPVRLLTNPSTGQMGIELAAQARDRGAEVTVIHGPRVRLPAFPEQIRWVSVVSAQEMLEAANLYLHGSDVVIAAAAVSDFRPQARWEHKEHKEDVGLNWNMERTPDVLQTLRDQCAGPTRFVGFAAESHQLEESAREKLRRKRLDFIVANAIDGGQGFGDAPYQAVLIDASGHSVALPPGKPEAARVILDIVGAALTRLTNAMRH